MMSHGTSFLYQKFEKKNQKDKGGAKMLESEVSTP